MAQNPIQFLLTEDDFEIHKRDVAQYVLHTTENVERIENLRHNYKSLSFTIEQSLQYLRNSLQLANYDNIFKLINPELQDLYLQTGKWNQFDDKAALKLGEALQINLKSLTLNIDKGPITKEGTSHILKGIQAIKTLEHLNINFDDNVEVLLQDLNHAIGENLRDLQLTFGQNTIVGDFSETNLPNLTNLKLIFRVSNKILGAEQLAIQLGKLKNLKKLELSLASGPLTRDFFIELGNSLKNLANLQELNLRVLDTNNLDQESFEVFSLGLSSLPINQLILDLGNYPSKQLQINHLFPKQVQLLQSSFGRNFNLLQSSVINDLRQMNHLRTLLLTLDIGNIDDADFGTLGSIMSTIHEAKIKFTQNQIIPQLKIYEVLQNSQTREKLSASLKNHKQQIELLDQSLFIKFDEIKNLDELTKNLNLEGALRLKLQFRMTNLQQEQLDNFANKINSSKLEVLVINITKYIGSSINILLELFQKIYQRGDWTFLSFQVNQELSAQYKRSKGKSSLLISIGQSKKIGLKGEELLASIIGVTQLDKVNLLVMMENQLSQKGQKLIANQLLKQINLQQLTFKVADSIPSISLFIAKMQSTINQFINDKKKITQTYGQSLTRLVQEHDNQVSFDMISPSLNNLVEDVQFPSVTAPQPHQQQFAMNMGFNTYKWDKYFEQSEG